MATVPEAKNYIQIPSVQTRSPVGEFLESNMGGDVNFLLTRDIKEHQWKANGAYSFFNLVNGVDTVWVSPFDGFITNVIIGHKFGGSGGQTIVDVKRSTDNGSTWNTIFTTTPEISSTAANFAWAGIGSSVTGFVAPVLIGAPAQFNINVGDGFRMDVTQVMTGNPQDLWIRFIMNTR